MEKYLKIETKKSKKWFDVEWSTCKQYISVHFLRNECKIIVLNDLNDIFLNNDEWDTAMDILANPPNIPENIKKILRGEETDGC